MQRFSIKIMKLDEYSNSEIVQLLGERYKEYRVRVGLTQKEISEKTNVSVMTIHRFESGAATNIALSTIISLLRAIGMLDNVNELLPEFVYGRLRAAFPAFDRKMKGFYTNDALLLATESRTSSPVRIVRDSETMSAVGLPGLYPCGEGAGYSGGIVSSAVDGILVATAATL